MEQPKFRLGERVFILRSNDPCIGPLGAFGEVVSIMQSKVDGVYKYTIHLDRIGFYIREFEGNLTSENGG